MGSTLPKDWVPPVARRQYGAFTVGQALDAGATVDQVRRRRESRWRRVVGDAFTLASTPPSTMLDAHAAWLTWPDGVLCLATAGRLHGLPVPADDVVHVNLPRHLHSRGRLVSHEMRMPRHDVVLMGQARVTSRARTLFDCIGRLPDAASERLVVWAVTRDLMRPSELEKAVAERPRWWGNARRRQAVEDTARGALSAAERRLHAILDDAEIVGWAADQRIETDRGDLLARADVLFRRERVVIEVDGLRFHGPEQFQDDRTRQNRLVAAGYTVLRFTWADLTDRPQLVASMVRETLRRLAPSPSLGSRRDRA